MFEYNYIAGASFTCHSGDWT